MNSRTSEFAESGDPWEGIEMPEGFDPEKNEFLRRKAPEKPSETGEFPALEWVVDTSSLALSSAEKTLEEWNQHYREIRMNQMNMTHENASESQTPAYASLADIYALFKHFVALEETPKALEISKRSFAEATEGKLIITSTRATYGKNTATFVHHDGFGELRTARTAPRRYLWSDLNGYLQHPEGVELLQAMFDTNDSAETMEKVFGHMFGERLLSTPAIRTETGDFACAFSYRVEEEKRGFLKGLLSRSKPKTHSLTVINCDVELGQKGYSLNANYKVREASE